MSVGRAIRRAWAREDWAEAANLANQHPVTWVWRTVLFGPPGPHHRPAVWDFILARQSLGTPAQRYQRLARAIIEDNLTVARWLIARGVNPHEGVPRRSELRLLQVAARWGRPHWLTELASWGIHAHAPQVVHPGEAHLVSPISLTLSLTPFTSRLAMLRALLDAGAPADENLPVRDPRSMIADGNALHRLIDHLASGAYPGAWAITHALPAWEMLVAAGASETRPNRHGHGALERLAFVAPAMAAAVHHRRQSQARATVLTQAVGPATITRQRHRA